MCKSLDGCPPVPSTEVHFVDSTLHHGRDGRVCWQLIWCHERCHKPELDGFRSTMIKCLQEACGRLVCLKKAASLERRLSHIMKVPAVLLTDWREAKPCMQVLAESPNLNGVVTVVVYTECKQLRAARCWAADLPRSLKTQFPVTILPHLGTAEEVTACAWELLVKSQMLQMPILSPQTDSEASESSDWQQESSGVSSGMSEASEGLEDMSMQPSLFIFTEATKWSSPVLQILAPIFPTESHEEVVRKLVQAMPMCYED